MKKTVSVAVFLAMLFTAVPTYAAVCETQLVSNASNQQGFGWNAVPIYDGATKFTAAQTCTVTSIGILYYWDSARADNAAARIYSDNAGTPNTVLETGSTITGASGTAHVGTSTFAGTTVLTSGTTYWIAYTAPLAAPPFIGLQGTADDGVTKDLRDDGWHNGNNPTKRLYYEIDGTIAAPASPATGSQTIVIMFGF